MDYCIALVGPPARWRCFSPPLHSQVADDLRNSSCPKPRDFMEVAQVKVGPIIRGAMKMADFIGDREDLEETP